MNADDFWRRQMERHRSLRRWWLRKLVRELENPGKRQSALRNAERWFGATSAAEVRELLEAIPMPRTVTRRGRKGRRRRLLRELPVESWGGHSVKRQEAADRQS